MQLLLRDIDDQVHHQRSQRSNIGLQSSLFLLLMSWNGSSAFKAQMTFLKVMFGVSRVMQQMHLDAHIDALKWGGKPSFDTQLSAGVGVDLGSVAYNFESHEQHWHGLIVVDWDDRMPIGVPGFAGRALVLWIEPLRVSPSHRLAIDLLSPLGWHPFGA